MAEHRRKKENAFKRFLKYIFPWKGDPPREVLRKIIFLISILVLIGVGGYFVNRWIQRNNYTNTNDKLQQLIGDDDDKFARLLEINPDFVGWLKIDGTTIDVPIVQTTDNDFYLNHDFYGNYTAYGNPFLDYRNEITPEDMDRNTIIYGHNMRDNLIFSELLTQYANAEGYKEAPIIHFDTLYGEYKWKVIAAFRTNADKSDDNGYAFPYVFTWATNDAFEQYIEELHQRSLFHTGVDVNKYDKIITLSTCDRTIGESGRFVVVARLVRDGEDESVDVSEATNNTNVRYPQAYCDKYGIKNNYANAEKWNPF